MLRRGVLVAGALLVSLGLGRTAVGGPPFGTADEGLTVEVHRGPGSCAKGDPGRGEWPSLNGDLENSRHQEREKSIGVAEAASLLPA